MQTAVLPMVKLDSHFFLLCEVDLLRVQLNFYYQGQFWHFGFWQFFCCTENRLLTLEFLAYWTCSVMWICCCCSAVFLGYKWFSVKKVNDHEDRFEKFFRLQGQLRNSVLFRGNEGLKLYILYIRVFSNWVRKIKKMSIQGYNRKHEATRGCLGNLLLLLFRKCNFSFYL